MRHHVVGIVLCLSLLLGNLSGGWICLSENGFDLVFESDPNNCSHDCGEGRQDSVKCEPDAANDNSCVKCLDLPLPDGIDEFLQSASKRDIETQPSAPGCALLPAEPRLAGPAYSASRTAAPRAPPITGAYFKPLAKIRLLL